MNYYIPTVTEAKLLIELVHDSDGGSVPIEPSPNDSMLAIKQLSQYKFIEYKDQIITVKSKAVDFVRSIMLN